MMFTFQSVLICNLYYSNQHSIMVQLLAKIVEDGTTHVYVSVFVISISVFCIYKPFILRSFTVNVY